VNKKKDEEMSWGKDSRKKKGKNTTSQTPLKGIFNRGKKIEQPDERENKGIIKAPSLKSEHSITNPNHN